MATVLLESLFLLSFQSSRLHRTASEIEEKNSVPAMTAGTNLIYAAGRVSLGFSGIHSLYELPLKRQVGKYNLFLFDGKQIGNLGPNSQWGINHYYFLGEAGLDKYKWIGKFARDSCL